MMYDIVPHGNDAALQVPSLALAELQVTLPRYPLRAPASRTHIQEFDRLCMQAAAPITNTAAGGTSALTVSGVA